MRIYLERTMEWDGDKMIVYNLPRNQFENCSNVSRPTNGHDMHDAYNTTRICVLCVVWCVLLRIIHTNNNNQVDLMHCRRLLLKHKIFMDSSRKQLPKYLTLVNGGGWGRGLGGFRRTLIVYYSFIIYTEVCASTRILCVFNSKVYTNVIRSKQQ